MVFEIASAERYIEDFVSQHLIVLGGFLPFELPLQSNIFTEENPSTPIWFDQTSLPPRTPDKPIKEA